MMMTDTSAMSRANMSDFRGLHRSGVVVRVYVMGGPNENAHRGAGVLTRQPDSRWSLGGGGAGVHVSPFASTTYGKFQCRRNSMPVAPIASKRRISGTPASGDTSARLLTP